MRISLCMIVKNEEFWLPKNLGAVSPFVDEMVVVDTGSTDNSIEIAQSLGARVTQIPWPDDFAAANNFALDLATGDWLLFLGADEIIQGPADTLRHLATAQADAYTVDFFNYFAGFEAPPTKTISTVRFFRNVPSCRFRGRIHETLTLPPNYLVAHAPLPLQIHHYGYTPAELQRKNKRQRDLRLLQMAVAEETDPQRLLYQRYNLAAAQRLAGDLAGATTLYFAVTDQLLVQDPPTGQLALAYLCECLIQLERFAEALSAVDKFLSHFSQIKEAWYWRASIMSKIGNMPEAQNAYLKVLQPPRPQPWLLAKADHRFYAICWLQLGNLYATTGKLRLATQCFAKAFVEPVSVPEALPRLKEILRLLPKKEILDWLPALCQSYPPLEPELKRMAQDITTGVHPPSWWVKLWQRLQRGGPGNLRCLAPAANTATVERIKQDGWQIYGSSDNLEIPVDSLVVLGHDLPISASALKPGGAFLIGVQVFPTDLPQWRTELETLFDATVNLLDPESDSPWLFAFGWRGEKVDPIRQSVLMVANPRSFQVFGGGEIQLLETLFGLNRLNVQADISLALRLPPEQYDLVHVFSLYQRDKFESLATITKPMVISPIYWNYAELRHATAVINSIFTQLPENIIPIALDDWKNGKLRTTDDSGTVETQDTPAFQAMVHSLFSSAKVILPNSHREIEIIGDRFGDISRKVRVITNAVHPGNYLTAKPNLFIDNFSLQDFVLSAGRFEHNKNQLMLIWALRNSDIPLVLAGPETNPKYAALCRRWAGPNVYFVGELSRDILTSAYAAARVHALPSWSETPGLVNLEAGLAGCALVVGNRGSEKEYLGDFAFPSDPGDPSSIRDAVLQAWNSKNPEKIAQQRTHILNHFTWDKTAIATMDAYKEALIMMDP